MGACIDSIADMTCDEFAAAIAQHSGFGGCEDPFEAKTADGDTCGNDADCTSGWCDGDSFDTNGNLMYGVCATKPGVGDPCPSYECADGGYCMGGNCVAAQDDGADCTSGDQCASGACNGYDSSTGQPGTCGTPMECDGV
jgi:hypothetical protein